jgi:hypothetical protein
MQENNETNSVAVEVAPENNDTAPVGAVPTKVRNNLRNYVVMTVAVVLLFIGLLFMLEREGRIPTTFFGGMNEGAPAIIVNGEPISKKDFESSLSQLLQMEATSGVDVTSETAVAGYRTQTVDTLVNGELLRQAAVSAGIVISEEAVNTRYAEIEAGVGGADELAVRMSEFGITNDVLRRDIENEILIQQYFDASLSSTSAEITDTEVEALYNELGGEAAGLPPMAEVYDQVVEQIKINRQQVEVTELLEVLRQDAEIEVLI